MDNLRLFKNLILFANKSNKFGLLIYFFLSIICAFTEVISLGTVIPYITSIINPDLLENNKIFIFFLQNTNFDLKNNLFFYATIIFIIIILISTFLKLLLLIITINLSKKIGYLFSTTILNNIINLSFDDLVKRNNNEIIASTTSKTDTTVNYIFNGLSLFSSITIIIFTTIFLLYVTFKISFFAFLLFSFMYLFIAFIMNPILNKNSEKIAILTTNKIKIAREILSSIKEILIFKAQKYFTSRFKENEISYRKSVAIVDFVSRSPRIILEAIAIIIIIFLSVLIMNSEGANTTKIISTLGILAFGAAKILPLMQNIYASWSQMSGSYNSVKDVNDFLRITFIKNFIKKNDLNFKKQIKIENLNFDIQNKNIIKNLNLEIKKNSLVGIYGSTGSGKSTLIDLIMGLRKPKTGNIKIDDINLADIDQEQWRNEISYVPQEIFLLNTTIENNIIFNLNKKENTNRVKLQEIIENVQLKEFVNSKIEKIDYITGENGMFLSGGQKQRIGLARALYKNHTILILDEATSALDSNTEEKILQYLSELKKDRTIIFVTHKKELSKYFDHSFDLSNEKK